MLAEETRFEVLRLLGSRPAISQREVASALGVSLGKVNYCLRRLIRTGFVKVGNFKDGRKRTAHIYLLTPLGTQHRAQLALKFLQRKLQECDALEAEVRQLSHEAGRRNQRRAVIT